MPAGKWPTVRKLGETGMGYVVVSVALRDGRNYPQVLIDSGCLGRVRSLPNIPFAEEMISLKSNKQMTSGIVTRIHEGKGTMSATGVARSQP